jgi:hypothetical protein
MMAASYGLLAAFAAFACGGENRSGRGAVWSERQAESVTVIRGMPVNVRHCGGIGPSQALDGTFGYRRFECVAGARLAGQPIDTVAVTYVLRPLAPFEAGARARRYVLRNVHFGGLGIP